MPAMLQRVKLLDATGLLQLVPCGRRRACCGQRHARPLLWLREGRLAVWIQRFESLRFSASENVSSYSSSATAGKTSGTCARSATKNGTCRSTGPPNLCSQPSEGKEQWKHAGELIQGTSGGKVPKDQRQRSSSML